MSDWDPINGYRSVSQLGTFSGCSWAWYLEKVVRVPRRTATWFVQGTSVHTGAEAYERSQRQMSVSEVVAVYEAAWAVDMAEAERRQPDHRMWMVGGTKSREEDIERRFALGRQQVIDYVEKNQPDNLWRPIELIPGEPAVEVEFLLDLDGVKVKGYIDSVIEHRETGELRVRDVKTGTKLPSDPFQMATYKIAVEDLTGAPVKTGVWWMCKDGKDSKPYPMVRFSRDLVTAWYVRMDNSIKAGSFHGRPSGDCFTCTVRSYCEYDNPNPIPLPELQQPVNLDFF